MLEAATGVALLAISSGAVAEVGEQHDRLGFLERQVTIGIEGRARRAAGS